MDYVYTQDTVVYLLLTAAIALLIFFTIISIRMIISLSRLREWRRKKEMARREGRYAQCLEERFRQDMGKNR